MRIPFPTRRGPHRGAGKRLELAAAPCPCRDRPWSSGARRPCGPGARSGPRPRPGPAPGRRPGAGAGEGPRWPAEVCATRAAAGVRAGYRRRGASGWGAGASYFFLLSKDPFDPPWDRSFASRALPLTRGRGRLGAPGRAATGGSRDLGVLRRGREGVRGAGRVRRRAGSPVRSGNWVLGICCRPWTAHPGATGGLRRFARTPADAPPLEPGGTPRARTRRTAHKSRRDPVAVSVGAPHWQVRYSSLRVHTSRETRLCRTPWVMTHNAPAGRPTPRVPHVPTPDPPDARS